MISHTENSQKKINLFRSRSERSYIFACQIAVPLVITPDLLYHLWNNFKQFHYFDEPDVVFKISHFAISDILLSNLCREVGFEVYEFEKEVRDILLNDLTINLGEKRKIFIATFLSDYAKSQHYYFYNENIKEIHLLTSQSILDPQAMEKKIIEKINQTKNDVEKINYLLLHHKLIPIGFNTDLSKISSGIADFNNNIGPILIEEDNPDLPGVLSINIELPSILQSKIKKIAARQINSDDLNSINLGNSISFDESEIRVGVVIGLTKTDVIVEIGSKLKGLISINEFRDLPNIKIGDKVEVLILEKSEVSGAVHLSRKLARATRSWQQIADSYKTGEVVTGTITSKTKGGLIVDIYGLETFLSNTEIEVTPVTDCDQYVGKTMDFKVVKINETIRHAEVSHKAIIESDIEEQRSAIIGNLEKGQILEGTVKSITDFGAFIDLGGVDGLLYITDISWGRVTHPSEVLHNSQKLNVEVLDFDDEKKRISLGLKQLTPHPWDNLPENISEGAHVKGKVVNIEDFGAFLEIMPGVEGLVHVSEITWSSQPINAKEFFKLGEEHEAVVVTLDKDERKMSLSIKQLSADPWETIEDRFPIDSKHSGTVKNITPYGVFVELETGIGGMIHISDLSWIKRYNHPSEFVKTGQEIDVVILGIDKENRKLSLGHKQLEEDPWDAFETVFPIGSIHEGSVTRKDDKGATVQLQYGLEAYAPARHLRKENGNYVEAEETLPFMIIEFDRNDKRILVSYSKVWEQVQKEEQIEQKKKGHL